MTAVRRYARTLPPERPDLRAGWTEIYPRAGVTDFNHADQFSDWLQDNDDWRHHLARSTAELGYDRGRRILKRRDGLTSAYPQQPGAYRTTTVHHTADMDEFLPRTLVDFVSPKGVVLRTDHPSKTDGVTTRHIAVMTPDEYEAMRQDAATADVVFPRNPHTPLPRQMSRPRRYAAVYRVPDYKTPGSNLEALRGELGLSGKGFAGKWFSRDRAANDSFHAPGKFQIHMDPGQLAEDRGDVIDARARELGVGSRTPMYLHPALTRIHYRGDESHPDFQELSGLVEAINGERTKAGVNPVHLEAVPGAVRLSRLPRRKLSRLPRKVVRYSRYTHADFLRKIAANERDRNTPLIYADWLGENGNVGVEKLVRDSMQQRWPHVYVLSGNGPVPSYQHHAAGLPPYSPMIETYTTLLSPEGERRYAVKMSAATDDPNKRFSITHVYDPEEAHQVVSGAVGIPGADQARQELETAHPYLKNRRYRRRGTPVRHAKVDGTVRAHPLVAGFPLEHFLRHLANTPTNSSNVRDLAKVALTGGEHGEKGPGAPEALWMLADALDEHENADGTIGHPEARHYNLRSAGDKVRLDHYTYEAVKEAANETRRRLNNSPHFDESVYSTEAHVSRLSNSLQGGFTIQPKADKRVLDYVKGRVRQSLPEVTDNDIEESLHRHKVRVDYLEKKKQKADTSHEDARALADHATDPPKGPISAKLEKAARYRRRYARRQIPEGWLAPDGTFHPLQSSTHSGDVMRHGMRGGFADQIGAYKAGWVRVTPEGNSVLTENHYHSPNQNQLGTLSDLAMEHGAEEVVHDSGFGRQPRTVWSNRDRLSRRRYALNARGDFIDALRRVRSRQQHALRTAAEQVSRRLGLHPTSIKDALHDGPQGASPGVAQAVYGGASPEAIQGAAAYLAMVNNATGFGVFHVRPGGRDLLHKFRVGGSGLELRARLDRAGITDRVLVPHSAGFDVMVPDPGGRLQRTVRGFARQQGSELQSSPGWFKVVGDADQSRARETFRGQVAGAARAMARPRRYGRLTVGTFGPLVNKYLENLEQQIPREKRPHGVHPANIAFPNVLADQLGDEQDPREGPLRRAQSRPVPTYELGHWGGQPGYALGDDHTIQGDFGSVRFAVVHKPPYNPRNNRRTRRLVADMFFPSDLEPNRGIGREEFVHPDEARAMIDHLVTDPEHAARAHQFVDRYFGKRKPSGTPQQMARPRRYAKLPQSERGQLNPEQLKLLDAATRTGDLTPLGALGDHLAENGFPNTGTHLSSILNLPQGVPRGLQTGTEQGHPGKFSFFVGRDGADLMHILRVFGSDGKLLSFWRRERPQGRA